MCYLVVERYSVCRCLYYQHSVDMCSEYGKKNHPIQERTVLVGYACERHTDYQQEALWSEGYSDSKFRAPERNRQGINTRSRRGEQGVKITSTVALRALQDAQYAKDDDISTQYPESSLTGFGIASSRTTVEDDSRVQPKFQGTSDHKSHLDDFRSRIQHPDRYIKSLQKLEENILRNSAVRMYNGVHSDITSADILSAYKRSYGDEDYVSYPIIPSELQDVIPNRLSDDTFSKDPTNTSDEEITAICKAAVDPVGSKHLNAIRLCRNVLLRTFLNLKMLQQHNFCAGSFSAIVLDSKRPNVATLVPIENTDFIALVYELEYVLRDTASLVLNTKGPETTPDIDNRFAFLKTPMINQYCRTLLQIKQGTGVVRFFSVFMITITAFYKLY